MRLAPTSSPPCAPAGHLHGHKRSDGRVATRNYIGILSSVNCSATAARAIADHFSRQTNPSALATFPNVDGVVALTHGTGCGMDDRGHGHADPGAHAGRLCHVTPTSAACSWWAWAARPTRSTPGWRTAACAKAKRCKVFNIQDTGGTRKTVEKGIALVQEMLPQANQAKREPCSAAHHHRPAVRRLGRLQRHQRQPGAGRGSGPAGGARRHRHPERDARDLRRRALADPPRGIARSGRKAGLAHQVVGAVHRINGAR
jgi:hypothetical protein